MKRFIHFPVSIFFLMAVYFPVINGQRPQTEQDAAGSRDDGLFSRYPGSVIEYYQQKVQPYFLVKDKPFYSQADASYVFPVISLNGLVSRILYSTPLQNTTDDLYNYYLNILEHSGFEILFKGSGKDDLGPPEEWYYNLFKSEKGYNPLEDVDITFMGSNHRFISARSTKDPDRPVYVSIFIEDDRQNWDFTIVLLDIIDVKSPLEN